MSGALRLRVLGSGNAVPSATRGCPGLLVRGAGETVLVDPGPGSLAAAARAGADAGSITGVLLTHLHIDHHLDLAALLFALRDPRFAGRPPLRVRGPAGLLRVHALWREAYGHWVEPAGYALDLREAGPGPARLGGLHLVAVAVPHGARPALAWRIASTAGGPVLAVSGDTGEGPGAVEAGRGADLFVLECTLPAGEATAKHLDPPAAGRVAAAAGCRRLLLVHFSSGLDGAPVEAGVREAFAGPLALARDGTEMEVGTGVGTGVETGVEAEVETGEAGTPDGGPGSEVRQP